MILIVNLNLTVDRMVEVDSLLPGAVHRAKRTQAQAGGKGVNVARMLKTLGEPCELLGLIGGITGKFIDSRLADEEIQRSLLGISGESRTSIIISESSLDSNHGNAQTVINEAGPQVTEENVEQSIALFSDRVQNCGMVILTGSAQPGFPQNIYRQLTRIANEAGKLTLLDASGDLLKEGIAASPTIVKPNQHEVSTLCQIPVETVTDAVSAARKMMEMGARTSAITLGKDGMVVATGTEVFAVRPPAIDARNAVGAGDATAAGFAAATLQGLSLSECARFAVACGSASALHGFGRCSVEEIEEIKGRTIVTRL